MQHFDLILIGGGTAALAAVSEALDLGVKNVAIIEKSEQLGGECALNACVPTKTLLTAARYLHLLQHKMQPYGIQDLEYRFNFKSLMSTVDHVINEGAYAFLEDARVSVFYGEAKFTSDDSIRVTGKDSKKIDLNSKHIIIATGSSPIIPKIPGLEETGYITFQQATHLQELPASLIIVGGGPVGVEFAQLFQALGVQVTLLQKGDRLLENEEPEISEAVQNTLGLCGVNVVLNCDIDNAICSLKQGCQSTLTTEEATGDETQTTDTAALPIADIPPAKCLTAHIGKKKQTFEAEEILIAIGMKPNVDSLRLDAANIRLAKSGGIPVNLELQTANPSVWAVGDVIGDYQFTHVADYHAILAVRNALKNAHDRIDYQGMGWAIYTEPTVAHVGLTEAQAKKEYGNIDVVICTTQEVSRYRIESDPNGFIKMIVDNKTQQVVGAHLYASNADDIAHTLILAIRNHMTVPHLLDMMYMYPAKAQLIQKALEKYATRHIQSVGKNKPKQQKHH